jgi:hypothetical protein
MKKIKFTQPIKAYKHLTALVRLAAAYDIKMCSLDHKDLSTKHAEGRKEH